MNLSIFNVFMIFSSLCRLKSALITKCSQIDDSLESLRNFCDADCSSDLVEVGYRCQNKPECVPIKWLCDNFEQCNDNTDETNPVCQMFDVEGCKNDENKNLKCKKDNGECFDINGIEEKRFRCKTTGECFENELQRSNNCPASPTDTTITTNCLAGIEPCKGQINASNALTTFTYDKILVTIAAIFLIVMLCSFLYKSITAERKQTDDFVDGKDQQSIIEKDTVGWQLIQIFDEKPTCWIEKEDTGILAGMKRGLSGSQTKSSESKNKKKKTYTLKEGVRENAKSLYSHIHDYPIQFQHLYNYFSKRSDTVQKFSKIVHIFYDWEKEIHNHDHKEVLKCWRSRLGISDLSNKVFSCLFDNSSMFKRFEDKCQPLRNCGRRLRRYLCGSVQNKDGKVFQALKTLQHSILPFLDCACFYFEMMKNMIYVNIFYVALEETSKNNMQDYDFEFGLVCTLVFSESFVQAIFILYSFHFSEKIFEVENSQKYKKWGHRILSVVIYPFIPIITLGNSIHNNVKYKMKIRHLQTYKEKENSKQRNSTSQNDDMESPDISNTGSLQNKLNLYESALHLEAKSKCFQRIYRYYRLTSAVISSAVIITVFYLLLFVTQRKNRKINFFEAVFKQLKYFYFPYKSMQSEEPSLVSILKLDIDIIIGMSLFYSLCVIVCELAEYWNSIKTVECTWTSWICIRGYILMMTINRLTTIISIFAISQPNNVKELVESLPTPAPLLPTITLIPATIIFFVFITLRFVSLIFYRRKFWKTQWSNSCFIEKWINISANQIVTIPAFIPSEWLQKNLLERNEAKETKKPNSNSSDKIQQETREDSTYCLWPCLNSCWKNLSFEEKREGEFLFMGILVIIENILSVCCEWINGGILTPNGHYYSWDVRLGTLFLALVFLGKYRNMHNFSQLNSISRSFSMDEEVVASDHAANTGERTFSPIETIYKKESNIFGPTNKMEPSILIGHSKLSNEEMESSSQTKENRDLGRSNQIGSFGKIIIQQSGTSERNTKMPPRQFTL